MLKRTISSYFKPDDATEKSKELCCTEMEKSTKLYNVLLIKMVKKCEKEIAVQLKIESALGSVDADQYQ